MSPKAGTILLLFPGQFSSNKICLNTQSTFPIVGGIQTCQGGGRVSREDGGMGVHPMGVPWMKYIQGPINAAHRTIQPSQEGQQAIHAVQEKVLFISHLV
jgi:hypothetical protein